MLGNFADPHILPCTAGDFVGIIVHDFVSDSGRHHQGGYDIVSQRCCVVFGTQNFLHANRPPVAKVEGVL